jgi:hypothetical protein
MGSEKKIPAVRCLSLFAVALLTACSSSGNSASASTPITIRYLDDSAAGTEIGYTYIAPGRSAQNPMHLEDDTWNGTSRSGATPSKIGGYWSFVGFKGTYDDGTAVDLAKVTADCTVKASFVEKQYQWTFSYRNGGRNMNQDWTADFDGAALPAFPSATDANPEWYQDSTFSGFSFSKDTGKTVFKDASLLRYESGSADPLSTSVSAAGTLYYSLALADGYNRSYPCWLSNGSEWFSLGSLKEGLKVQLDAAYTKTLKKFQISFYPSQADYTAKTNVRTETLSFTYGSTLTIDTSDPLASKFSALAANEMTPSTITLTNSSAVTTWHGVYTGAEGLDAATDRYLNGGEILKDQSQLFENCAFYPA